jgi:CRP/FNR family transcriptional regulator
MKKSKLPCDLKSCFMCRTSLKEWLPALGENRINYQVKKGEVIFREGEPVKGVYFVYEGKVKVHKQWGNDKELIIRFAKKGSIFGHRGLGSNLVYPVSATALEPCVVCFIDIEFFNATLKVNNEFAYTLMLFFADELQESERKMRNLAHMPVKGRVAQALISLREKFGLTAEGFIDIELTRQDLASYAGATYETVFRIINDLVQDKMIKLSGKSIMIIDDLRLDSLTHQQVTTPVDGGVITT